MIAQRVALRPRSLAELGDLSFALVRRHPRAYALLLPWVLVPLLALRAVGLPEEATWALLLPATALGTPVFTVLCGDLMLRPAVDLRSVQARTLRRLPVFLLVRVATWLPHAVLPGIALAWTSFAPEVVLLERGAARAVFARSTTLLRSAPTRWLWLGLATLAGLAAAAGAGHVAEQALRGVLDVPARPGEGVPWAAVAGVATAAPYFATLRFLAYIDCRTRHEGWDLQLRMSALAEAEAARTASAPAASLLQEAR